MTSRTVRTESRPTCYERRWWILGVLCFSLLVIVARQHDPQRRDPDARARPRRRRNSQLQWIVDAYTLVFAGLLLTAGSLGDRFGRRGALQSGSWSSGSARSLSAFVDTPSQLIATRAFMGIGGAFIMPATLSIITNVFPPEERGKAIGVWAGVAGLAVALGPLTGGFLLEHFYWGSVFLVNVPIVVVGARSPACFLIPTSKDPSAPRLDPVGAVLSIVGLVVAASTAIIEAPTERLERPDDPRRASASASSLLVAFVAVGAPQRPPDARPELLQEPAVHRRERRHHADRSSRCSASIVPAHAVLPVRARLLAARGRRPPPARRPRR